MASGNKQLPEVYTEAEFEAVEAHISKYFGEYANVFHEIVSPDIHVDICIIGPTPERNHYTLVTMGMGAHRMNVPDALKKKKLDRAEILVTLPPDWKIGTEDADDEIWYWPLRWLKILARLPGDNDTWLGYGHTVPNGEPFAENTDLCCALLTFPYDFDDEAIVCELPDGDEINFYQMLPLYEDEVDYKLENGAEALESLFGDFDRVLDINRPSFCLSGRRPKTYKINTEDMERFKDALAGGGPVPDSDIEEFAALLGEAILSDDDDESTYEDAAELLSFLNMLFLCYDRLPHSLAVRGELFYSILVIMTYERADIVEGIRLKLFALLEAAPKDKGLSRAYATVLVQIISNYLGLDPADMGQVQSYYAALEKMVEQYAADPVIPAMLAWGKRDIIQEISCSDGPAEAKTALRELQSFSGRYKDNALVANEYAVACSICFSAFVENSDFKEAEKLLDELERIVREYGVSYREWPQTEPDYRFPGYAADGLDNYFLTAVWDIAQKHAEDEKHGRLMEDLNRVQAMPVYPDTEDYYNEIRAQIISQLIAVHAKKRPEEAFKWLGCLKE